MPSRMFWDRPNRQPGLEVDQKVILPTTVADTSDKIDLNGFYIIDTGITLYLYVMKECNPEVLKEV